MNSSQKSICLTVAAHAKVNWYLELLGKRDDGFHQLETFMSTVSLSDTLSFSSRSDGEFNLKVTHSDTSGPKESVPAGAKNLVLRAAQSIRERCDDSAAVFGFDIHLHKRIPSAAGLGGASSDAAATLKALNFAWGSPLDSNELHFVASELGSDVPFFLDGGTAFCEGRGELISRMEVPAGHAVVIGKPPAGLSTPEVYSRVRISGERYDSSDFDRCLRGGDVRAIGSLMQNRLQEFAIPLNDQIQFLQHEFQLLQDANRCCGHQLSGSGSSYFGLFRSRRLALSAARRLKGRLKGFKIFCCHTIGSYGLGNSDQGTIAA